MISWTRPSWLSWLTFLVLASGPVTASISSPEGVHRENRPESHSRFWQHSQFEVFQLQQDQDTDAETDFSMVSSGTVLSVPAGTSVRLLNEAVDDDGERYFQIVLNEKMSAWVREAELLEIAFIEDEVEVAGDAPQFIQPVKGQIRSRPGYRAHPVLKVRKFHKGTDISAPSGSPVTAAADGEVSFAGWSRGYGRTIRIRHDGRIETVYAHLSVIRVKAGQRVSQGSLIGNVGSSGLSTGPHLHFERNAY